MLAFIFHLRTKGVFMHGVYIIQSAHYEAVCAHTIVPLFQQFAGSV